MNDVVVFGASGYSGLEILRLLRWHPDVRVVAASSDRWAGQRVADAVAGWTSPLAFANHAAVEAEVREGQVALLATPASTSAELAPRLLARGLRVVDLSGAYRLTDPAQYAQWYGFTHPHPQLLSEARYGVPELLMVPPDTRLVANPGCYATAAIMLLAPLVKRALLVDGAPLIVDGKSGTTGAGRNATEGLLHAEVSENLRAYRVTKHRHTPEIERAVGMYAGRDDIRVQFTAHLIPMRRGILASAYLVVKPDVSEDTVRTAYAETYREQPFVRLVDRPPETAAVRDSNHIELGATVDTRTGVLCAFAAIDNLVKGAAGQAVQNLNRLLGLPTARGLLPEPGA